MKKLGSFLDNCLLHVAANLERKTKLEIVEYPFLRFISIELNKDLEVTKNKDF